MQVREEQDGDYSEVVYGEAVSVVTWAGRDPRVELNVETVRTLGEVDHLIEALTSARAVFI